jgi:hypothetical protein
MIWKLSITNMVIGQNFMVSSNNFYKDKIKLFQKTKQIIIIINHNHPI